MISVAEWKWMGQAGHFWRSNECRYHLATVVGEYLISTVGDYHSSSKGDIEPINSTGCYETLVFRTTSIMTCGCHIHDGSEIECREYGKDVKCTEVDTGHFEMCMKYAALQGVDAEETIQNGVC